MFTIWPNNVDSTSLRRDNVAVLAEKREIRISNIGQFGSMPTYTDENWDILAEIIRTTASLEKLEFQRGTAIALQNDKVAHALANNRTIKTLSSFYAGCGNKGAKAVAAILKENSTIEVVYLYNNNISGDGAKAIAEALKVNKTLQHIYLNSNRIGRKGARVIADSLKQNKSLRYIDLEHNQIGNEGAKAIAEALKENASSLQELLIERNNIGDQGAKVIAEALKDNTSLQKLFLSGNSIGVEGAKAIAEALKQNKSLQTLMFSGNQIGVEGAKAFAEALKENASLRELDIKRNNIGDEGAKAFAEALKENHSLQKLDIERNSIGEEGGQDILNALQQIESAAIENIDLLWNKIPEFFRTKINQEVIRIKNRSKGVGANEGQVASVATAAGGSQGVQNERSSSNEGDRMPAIHTTNASSAHVQETNGTEHNTTAMATKIKEQQSNIAQLQDKIAEQNKEIASMKDILKTIGDMVNGRRTTSNTSNNLPDRETELQSEIERYKQENDSLKEQLKNSRPIETVDLTNKIDSGSSSGGDDSNEEEPPSKRQRTKSNLAVALEQTQQMVKVKEEAKERAAVAEANVASSRREKDAVEASLRDVQEDLEDSNELVTQQTLTTDIWQGRFDELFELARAAGVDGNTLSEIRYRPLSSGR